MHCRANHCCRGSMDCHCDCVPCKEEPKKPYKPWKELSKAMACGPEGPKAHLALVEKWKDIPNGMPVIVTKDDGSEFKTKKRSIPWMLGADNRDESDPTHSPGHTAVMMVEGITGGYGLWRIRLDQEES